MAKIKIRKKHPTKTYSQRHPEGKRFKRGEKIEMNPPGPDTPPRTSQGFTKFGNLPHRSEPEHVRGKRTPLSVKPHKRKFKIVKGKRVYK